MRLSELEAVVESLLFIAGDAVSLASIAQTIELDQATTRAVVLSLADKYEKEKRGLRIVEIADAYQMCTAAECFEYIRNMYKSPQRQGLTQSLLETLAIIAYKLICEVGRADTPGKPILFGTSKEFLRYFGFKSIRELPPLEEENSEEAKEKDAETEFHT